MLHLLVTVVPIAVIFPIFVGFCVWVPFCISCCGNQCIIIVVAVNDCMYAAFCFALSFEIGSFPFALSFVLKCYFPLSGLCKVCKSSPLPFPLPMCGEMCYELLLSEYYFPLPFFRSLCFLHFLPMPTRPKAIGVGPKCCFDLM